MKQIAFFLFIFKKYPLLIMLNISFLVVGGLIDALSIISLIPAVDLFVNPDLQNVSVSTQYIIRAMKVVGIPPSLGSVLAIFVLLVLIRSIFYIVSRYFIVKTRYRLQGNVLLGTFEDFFNARWAFFSSNKQGTLLNTFTREIQNVGEAYEVISNYIAYVLQCCIFILVPFYISWKVAMVSLGCAIVFMLPFVFFGKIGYRLGQINTKMANKMISVIQESIGSAKIILGFGKQEKSRLSLAEAFDSLSRATIKSQTLTNAIPQMYYPFGILVLVITMYVGRTFANTLSEIVAVLYSFMRILPIVGNIMAQRTYVNHFFPSYEQVMELRRNAGELKQTSGTRPFAGLKNNISLEKVSFAYSDDEAVLKDVDMNIRKGKMVAVVGRSGSGKSTLIDMIMGFNQPLHGRISIDGVPLRDFDILSYRSRIGYVPQESALFNMTIRDNLLWAKEDASDSEIEEACDIANALEFIKDLPDAYSTMVGDRGVRLSGGQIQRIALARAVLRKPDILILDEATSSLDTQSERLIQHAIENIAKRTTVIIIAHRLSTIINADHIYVLDEGRVIEEGTHAELISKNGSFSRMHLIAKDVGKEDAAEGNGENGCEKPINE
jgi:ATP-binding cassette subfamily B protein